MLTVATEGMHNLEEEYLLKAKSMGLAGVLIYTAHRRMPSSWEAFCANFPILFLANTDPLGDEIGLTLIARGSTDAAE